VKRVGLFLAIALAAGVASAEDTTITGDRMEFLNKGAEVLFTGGVHLVRGTDDIKASEMRTNKERDKVTAKGDVKLFRQTSATETWRAFGDSGFYDTQSGQGYLKGKRRRQAKLVREEVVTSTITRTIVLFADRIDFSKEPQRAYAVGHVHGETTDPKTGDNYEFDAHEAEYRGDDKRVVLFGKPRPIVNQPNGPKAKRVTGDRIIYYVDERRMIAEGSARAVLRELKEN
jgi:lipopolysaccharide export system protein LptA